MPHQKMFGSLYLSLVSVRYVLIRPQGYKTFYMLNLTEHEIYHAHLLIF